MPKTACNMYDEWDGGISRFNVYRCCIHSGSNSKCKPKFLSGNVNYSYVM